MHFHANIIPVIKNSLYLNTKLKNIENTIKLNDSVCHRAICPTFQIF